MMGDLYGLPFLFNNMSSSLPPGKYFIGDPYRVISLSVWDRFLDSYFYQRKYTNCAYMFGDRLGWAELLDCKERMVCDNQNNTYLISKGMIGATPIKLSYLSEDYIKAIRQGLVIDAKTDLICDECRGIFTFTFNDEKITIETVNQPLITATSPVADLSDFDDEYEQL